MSPMQPAQASVSLPGASRALARLGALLLTLAMFAAAAGAWWQSERGARAAIDAELRRSAQVIGQVVAGELARALGLGIPLPKLVGVPDWLDELIEANPAARWVALSDADGQVLWSRGTDAAALSSQLANTRTEAVVAWQGGQLATQALRHDGRVMGWVHVATGTAAVAPRQWALASVLAAVLAGLAAWLWWRWLQRHLHAPLRSADVLMQQLAEQAAWPFVPPAAGAGPAVHLVRQLGQRVNALHLECAQLQLKAGEVRAAHFDPGMLARIDQLADTLAQRQGTAAQEQLRFAEATTQQARAARSVHQLVLRALVLVVVVLAALVWFGVAPLRAAHERQLLASAEQGLQQAWRATLDRDGNSLEAVAQRALQQPHLLDALQRHDAERLDELLPTLVPDGLVLTAVRPDGSVLAASSRRRDEGALDRTAMATLLASKGTASGVWQSPARGYRSGHATRLSDQAGAPLYWIVSQPLEVSLAELARRTGDTVALADTRGQPVVEGASGMLERWSAQGRRSFIDQRDGATLLVSELPVTALSGHVLGKIIAAQPLADRLSTRERLALGLGLLLALAALAWVLRGLLLGLAPLRSVVQQLDALAWAQPAQADAAVRPRRLLQALRRVDERIEALERVRRSRLRQGKRQARFIRHQMMELAARLDEQARAAVLADLQRIERAGAELPRHEHLPAAVPDAQAAAQVHDPRLERMADEVGVLALGFQSLVSRVGDQYQQLGHLVQELREALRVKTRFIAIQQELEIARKMQSSFLPHEFHVDTRINLHATMQPAKEVGGDFYDFFAIDAHRVAVVVADVSGKGVPAAFFMAVSRTLLRAVAQFGDRPGACLRRLNDLLASNNEEMMFVTLFYAIVDLRDGSVQYANGGHNPPYVLRADGRVQSLGISGDVALAVMADMDYQDFTVQLQPGDGLFMFTDGVTEACDIDQQFYGEARLEAWLADQHATPVADIPANVVAAIHAFERGAEQADDITCLVLRLRATT